MGKTSSAVKARYNAKVYDRLQVTVKKGKKEVIQEQAKQKGYTSVNSYIQSLIDKDLKG